MAFSGLQKTRQGLVAIARSLYGSFTGKTEAISNPGPGFGVGSTLNNNGIGLAGSITNTGVGKVGPIQLGFGVGSSMNNQGLGLVGNMTNTGIGKEGNL